MCVIMCSCILYLNPAFCINCFISLTFKFSFSFSFLNSYALLLTYFATWQWLMGGPVFYCKYLCVLKILTHLRNLAQISRMNCSYSQYLHVPTHFYSISNYLLVMIFEEYHVFSINGDLIFVFCLNSNHCCNVRNK